MLQGLWWERELLPGAIAFGQLSGQPLSRAQVCPDPSPEASFSLPGAALTWLISYRAAWGAGRDLGPGGEAIRQARAQLPWGGGDLVEGIGTSPMPSQPFSSLFLSLLPFAYSLL